VQIKGVDPRFAKVTNYAESIWWKPLDKPLPKDKERRDPRLEPNFKHAFEQFQQDALRFQEPDPEHGDRLTPAIVLGIELGGFSIRDEKGRGYYRPAGTVFKRMPNGEFEPVPGFLPLQGVTVTVLPLTEKTRDLGVVQQYLPVANEYRTGLYESDRSSALMDLGELQRMLKLNEWERLEPVKTDPYAIERDASGREVSPGANRRVIGKEPARVTTVLVKAKSKVSPEKLHARCVEIWGEFAAAHLGEVPSAEAMADSRTIQTFEMSRATFIGAVRQETAVVLFLLIMLSAIAATLILSIFWAMVSEKTKDIGTLRAIGASGPGVAWIWLRFGLFIGVVGAVLGLIGATAIVWNINPIHEWLGEVLGLSLWDPKVYYFTKIPSEVDPIHAAIVGAGALVFSLLGALLPAIRAARMDPVKALRFE
jgi:lipoprotein-releasing system permease protein